MHTVEVLDLALQLANRLGYRVRHDWLGGTLGGACQLRGQKLLFLDPSATAQEQLEIVLATLRADPALREMDVPDRLVDSLAEPLRRVA